MLLFDTRRGWIDPVTREKISIVGAKDSVATLLELMDEDQIPQSWGGTCTCVPDGQGEFSFSTSPFLSLSYILFLSIPVNCFRLLLLLTFILLLSFSVFANPELDSSCLPSCPLEEAEKAMEGYQEVHLDAQETVVPARSIVTIEHSTDCTSGAEFEVFLRLEKNDIVMSAEFVPSSASTERTETGGGEDEVDDEKDIGEKVEAEPVWESKKYDSWHLEPFHEVFICSQPGTLRITFDNSYSYFTKKSVLHTVHSTDRM